MYMHTCTCNSCLMVFTVYGICTAQGLYALPRAEYIQHEGGTIPCTVKTMRQLTCTDRPYEATARLASTPEYTTYCTLAVQCKVLYARCCSYSSIA